MASLGPHSTAAELAQASGLPPEALDVVAPDASALDFVKALSKAKRPADAVPVLAHALPDTDAIEWASECCTMAAPADVPAAETQALAAARAWAAAPSPETAAAAGKAADGLPSHRPAAWAARAAEWSQAPPAALPGAEAPDLGAHAAAGSVRLAAAEQAGVLPPDDPSLAAQSAMENGGAESATPEDTEVSKSEAKAIAKALKPFVELGTKALSKSMTG